MTSHWVIVLMVLSTYGISSESYYKTYYVENSCLVGNETINYTFGLAREQSAFILKTKQSRNYNWSKNCTVYLKLPSPSYQGVVLSIKNIDLTEVLQIGCPHYIKIFKVPYDTGKICKLKQLLRKSYQSNGDMHFLYYVAKTPGIFLNQFGFEFTATAYRRRLCGSRDFRCSNGNCVWNGLKCDGCDNCGDNSDEDRYTCRPTPKPTEKDNQGKYNRDRNRDSEWSVDTTTGPTIPSNILVILCFMGAGVIILSVGYYYCKTWLQKHHDVVSESTENIQSAAADTSAPPYELIYPHQQQPLGLLSIYSPRNVPTENQNVQYNPYYRPGRESHLPPPPPYSP